MMEENRRLCGKEKATGASSLSGRQLATTVLFPALDLQRKDEEDPVCRQGNSPEKEGAVKEGGGGLPSPPL